MATATDVEQPPSLPVPTQSKALTLANTKIQTQVQTQVRTQTQTQTQIQKRPLPSTNVAGKPVNRPIKRDSGHSNNSYGTMSSHGNASMHTHAHKHQKHGSANSNGSSAELGAGTDNAVADCLSFSQRAAQIARSPTPLLVKGDHHLLRDIDRPPPGDPSTRPRRKSLMGGLTAENTTGCPITGDPAHLARKRSQYFEDAFATRRDADTSPAKERVRSEALVLADVRTNVIVGDEFTVVTELSAHLALRYRRPLSSIVVTLQHGACMCFGGSFAPAYVMAVYGLPPQLQPATNKRNAALIQRHMEETLGVTPTRGHLRFVAVPEANLAYGGTTALGHADDLARSGEGVSTGSVAGHNSNGMYRSPVGSVTFPAAITTDAQSLGNGLGSRKYKTARKLSIKSLSSLRLPSPSPPELTPPPSAVDEHPPAAQLPAIPERSVKEEDVVGKKNKNKMSSPSSEVQGVSGSNTTPPPAPTATTLMAVGQQPSRRARRTKSFVATLFGRSTPKPEGGLP